MLIKNVEGHTMKYMTKKHCIITCALINIIFIFGQIYNHTQRVKYTYLKQQKENDLLKQKQTIQELSQQLYALKDRKTIQEYAQTTLGMKPIQIKHVKRVA